MIKGKRKSKTKEEKTTKKLVKQTSSETSFEALLEAVEKNDVELVKKIIEEEKIDNREGIAEIVNQKVEGRITFLLLAIGFNNVETVKLLLENGAVPELTDRSGKNCFHYAAKRGNLEMLKLLASYTKKNSLAEVINTHDNFGLSVLHDAATGIVDSVSRKDENWAVIGWLLEQGADYNYKVKNSLWEDFSVETIFSQKDWSYVKNFQNIVREFENKRKELKEAENEEKIFFQEIIEGKEEVIDKLNENARKKLKDFLELKKQLEMAKESLIKEIGVEKLVEKVEKSELVANLEVNPWRYLE